MKILKFCILIGLALLTSAASAQLRFKVVNGLISVDDISPSPKRYIAVADGLDSNLKIDPNDTTSLFCRALLYLQFNSFVVNPDIGTQKATNSLLLAKSMADRADSLRMQNLALKILKAQICKELTNRYAAIETWRFNAQQLAERKRKFNFYKDQANHLYDQLAVLDKKNAYVYQRLMIK